LFDDQSGHKGLDEECFNSIIS